MALSRERIADELLKTLALPDPTTTFGLMIERGIFAPVLPEIVDAEPLGRLIRRTVHFRHSRGGGNLDPQTQGLTARDSRLRGNDESVGWLGPSPIRRLAALLPPHPETAANIATRLKLSKAQRKRLAAAAARMPGDTAAPRALAYRLGMESAIDRLLLCVTNDIVVGNALETLAADPPPEAMPLKGGDLIAMGVEAGPEVARLLREVEDAWIAEDFPDESRLTEIAEEKLR